MPTYCYVKWDFGIPEVNDVQMDVTVHMDLPNFPWMYLQTYEFRMYIKRPEFKGLGIYSYHGLQSNVYDPLSNSGRGKGVLFSRYETLDPNDLSIGSGGWYEIPDAAKIVAEGGKYVSVRNTFQWGKGQYRLSLFPLNEDDVGLWYCFRVLDLLNGRECNCGSLRFPKLGKRPGIPNLGTTFLEMYPQNNDPASFPFWHISIHNIKANQGQLNAKSAIVTYDDNQIPGRNSDVSLGAGNQAIEFKVGSGVMRNTVNGTVLHLQ